MRKPVLVSGTALALLLGTSLFPGVALATPGCLTTDTPAADAMALPSVIESGAHHCWVVPEGVTSVHVVAVGGAGGASAMLSNSGYMYSSGAVTPSTPGGAGARVEGDLAVQPGQVLDLSAGLNGADGATNIYSGYGGTGAQGGRRTSIGTFLIAGAGGGAGGGANSNSSGGSPGGRGGNAGLVAGDGVVVDPAPVLMTNYGNVAPGRPGTGASTTAAGLGGARGTSNQSDPVYLGAVGTDGLDSSGGTGGAGANNAYSGSGGSGGDGAFGGGGGGGGSYFNFWAGGGGGGAGSSLADPASTSGVAITTDRSREPRIQIAASLASLAPATGVAFTASQAITTVSASRTVTVTNTGNVPLATADLSVGGADADDFFVAGDTCRASVPVGATCTVQVRFAPQAAGARSATLNVSHAAPIALSGVGSAAPVGAKGDAGVAGQSGSNGAAGAAGVAGTAGINGKDGDAGKDGVNGTAGKDGAAGRDGADASTSCLIQVSRTKANETVETVECQISTVAGKPASRATLSRYGRTVARGTERQGSKLKLKPVKGASITPGRYRLARTYKQARRTVTERRWITIS